MSKLNAVILTGARDSHNPLLVGTGVQNKALLPIIGKPMVAYVLEALAGSRYQPEIYISTSDPDIQKLRSEIPFKTLPSETSAAQSFLRSLERVPGAEWVLFVSGDHPLLTPEMIDYFVDEVIRRDLAAAAAMVPRSLVNRDYPSSQRTYWPMKEDGYSGGNLYLINKRKFTVREELYEMLDQNRKMPLKSIRVMDWGTILQVLLRQLEMDEFMRRASKILGCPAGVVKMPFAECCMDVDKPSDKEIAERILQARQAATYLPPQATSA